MDEVEWVAAHQGVVSLAQARAQHEARSHRVVFEVSPETYATLREAQAQLTREHGGRLSEDEMLLLMSRKVLGGPADAGTSSYQIQMTICEACGRASQDGGGTEV